MNAYTENLAAVLAGCLGLLLGFAGLMKIAARHDFMLGLMALPVLPRGVALAVSVTVPAIEIILSVLFFIGPSFASLLAVPLFATFIAVTAYVSQKRLRVPCNCFGSGDRMLSTGTIKLNVALIAACLFVSQRSAGALSMTQVAASAGVLVGVLCALQLALNQALLMELASLGFIAPPQSLSIHWGRSTRQ